MLNEQARRDRGGESSREGEQARRKSRKCAENIFFFLLINLFPEVVFWEASGL